jgi:signal transduction histidine kinase
MHLPYKKIFDGIPFASFITDSHFTVIGVNTTARAMLDMPHKHILHQPISRYMTVHPSTRQWSDIAALLHSLRSYDLTVALTDTLKQPDKEYLCHISHLTGSHDEDLFCLMLIDMPDVALVKRTLHNKNVRIAQVQAELLRHNKEASDLSTLKSNFLSIASHELKTPLTSIKGYSDLLMDSAPGTIDDSFITQLIKNINRSSARLTNVVNNILDISRVQENRLELHPEYCNITDIIKDCIEELTPISDSRHIGFRCEFATDLPRFYGDISRIYRQFFNILTNAIKFSPDHSSVTIKVYMEEPDTFHISVRDTGIGISKQDQKRIFDPFVKLSDTSKHTSQNYNFMGGGAGLGLSVVKGIIECHGGHIWVESTGKEKSTEYPGSVFHLLLPRELRQPNDEPADETAREEIEEGPGSSPAVSVSHTQSAEERPALLLVDDSRHTTDMIKKLLRGAFELITATSAEQALQKGFSTTPECILINEGLKGLDAVRLCRLFRTQPETKKSPLGLYSLKTKKKRMQDAFNAGADEYIVLPLSDRDFVEKIWHLLIKKKESFFFA